MENTFGSRLSELRKGKKITQEQDRLDQWESRQKKYFANLETLLKKYNTQKDQLTSQLKQLSSSSSSSS